MADEERRNIVTPEQMKILQNYKREKKLKERNDIIKQYKEIIKNNESYLLNCIEGVVTEFEGKMLSKVQFKYFICKVMRIILESNGFKIQQTKKNDSILGSIAESNKYWELYSARFENLKEEIETNQPEDYSIARERKKVKRKEDFPHILTATKTKSPRKYGSISDNDLENYKLDYLFYTTDSENTLPNKKQFSEKINVEDIKKNDTHIQEVKLKEFSGESTVKVIETKARIGHSNIYCKNLEMTMPCCPITKISDVSLLRHSHIKPWSVSNDSEKLDGYNGLLLEYGYDMLFDKGWISFENNGVLLVSPKIPKDLLRVYWLLEDGKVYNIFNESGKRDKYLEYHRKNIFKS